MFGKPDQCLKQENVKLAAFTQLRSEEQTLRTDHVT
jgi:hypothetical protein